MRWNIRVALGENARDLGTLRFDAQGARESAAFAYDAEWLSAGDGFAIDPRLPLVTGPQFHRRERGGSVFHGAIADTEPGCRATSRRWLPSVCCFPIASMLFVGQPGQGDIVAQFVSLYDAKTRLSALVDRAAAGEEIVISKNGVPRARLVPIERLGEPRTPANAMRIAHMAADFDEPDPRIEQMFGGETA